MPAAVVLAIAATLLGAVPADAKVRHAERLLQVGSGTVRFSPNGDGSQDRTVFSYRPSQRASVTVTVRDARGAVVRTVDLGKQSRAWHAWWWNGRKRGGAHVRDGAYRVTFTATTARLRDSDSTRAVTRSTFDRSPNGIAFSPAIHLDRDAIYRDTTYFKDQFTWVGEEYRVTDDGSPEPTGASRITGPDGAVVYQHADNPFEQARSWDGTDQHGDRVPAGTYLLTNTWVDRYGNHLSATKPLVVADGSRVEQHFTVPVTPSEARVGTATEPYEFLAGGPKTGTYLTYACPPRASERFPDGALSFSLYDERCTVSDDTFRVDSPVDLDLTFDTVRLTTVGGPTTAGGEGTATLALTDPQLPPTTTVAGDEASTVLQTQRGWSTEHVDELTWRVARASGGYDVKSFTLDIYHYVPPA
ncbi:hypothetical protein GCM10023349_11170 [Nocardioides conyzicola]|uniref:FlgD/Vpr Ig-like domain-containing protein n=1 Tax=Nocardioides conyzicola TaxID=1651781 RepID=A0ABP8WZ87_9ACTN